MDDLKFTTLLSDDSCNGKLNPPINAEISVPSSEDVSQLLCAWSNGDQDALDKLAPIVYDELCRLARLYMRRERPGHSFETTVGK